MALDLPTESQTIVDRMSADIAAALPGSIPTLRNSFLKGIIIALSNRDFDFYIDLNDVLQESNPGTAVFTLPNWANTKGVTQLSGTKASGILRVAAATAGGVIPIGTLWSAVNGREYTATSEETVALDQAPLEDLIKITTVTAEVTFEGPHGYISGENMSISASTNPLWITAYTNIQIVDNLTILISGVNPAAPTEIGTPALANTFTADVPVDATEVGVDGDLNAGGIVTLNASIPTATDVLSTSASALGVSGGVDQESFEDFRDRYLEEVRNPIAHFNASDITSVAKTINGVTRVFVFEVTPAVGQTEIFFMRDNDESPIPSAGEVALVNTEIQNIRPATTIEADVVVAAPTPIDVDYVFTVLNPNTLTMQSAVTESLRQFFAEETSVGVDVSEDRYNAAIITTIDPDTGDNLLNFTLTSPTPGSDPTIASGEIGVLGTVAYP